MMRNLLIPTTLLPLLAVFALPAALAANSADVLAKYDTDHDKTLDLNEAKAAASARFDHLDTDSDHTLDPKETSGVIGKKAFESADPDHDGKLSKDEYLALVEKVFKRADVDHDGTISADELDSPAGKELSRLIG